jgi:hypothetical protein
VNNDGPFQELAETMDSVTRQFGKAVTKLGPKLWLYFVNNDQFFQKKILLN